jgi:hypothetical protein
MYLASSTRRLIQVVAIGIAVGLAQLTILVPAASAQSSGDGYVRLAHLSPNTPPVDVYLYSFGDAAAQLVLHNVSYGTVSPFEELAAGEYTVAMRLAGAVASSKPVLSTTVNVAAGDAYTVAGMGPTAGLRLEVFNDPLTTPSGSALVQVIQASLQQDSVSVTTGGTQLASGLPFGQATAFVAVPAGSSTVHVTGPTETASEPVTLSAGTVQTLVVLDGQHGLAIDPLLDAAGSSVAPVSGADTGLGGAASRPGAPVLPWLLTGLAGLLLAVGGAARISRRRHPARHAR